MTTLDELRQASAELERSTAALEATRNGTAAAIRILTASMERRFVEIERLLGQLERETVLR